MGPSAMQSNSREAVREKLMDKLIKSANLSVKIMLGVIDIMSVLHNLKTHYWKQKLGQPK